MTVIKQEGDKSERSSGLHFQDIMYSILTAFERRHKNFS